MVKELSEDRVTRKINVDMIDVATYAAEISKGAPFPYSISVRLRGLGLAHGGEASNESKDNGKECGLHCREVGMTFRRGEPALNFDTSCILGT